jgi:predicted DCC family thiol-disulfide oxidoreductase YuxK
VRDDGDVAATERPVFVFDGDCAFCSSCARFIERRIRPSADVEAWQFADLDALGLTEDRVSAAVCFVAPGRITEGPAAIADLLRRAGLLWRAAGAVLGLRPITALAWPVYRWVARNRHRMPGGTATCALPPGHPARTA